MHRYILPFFLSVSACTAQQDKQRLLQLAKQIQELQAQVKIQQQAADLDLQAKCGTDARIWFNQNYRADKNATLLDFSNHYNKALNRCFILVQHKYWLDERSRYLSSQVVAYDIYENLEKARSNEILSPGEKDFTPTVICRLNNDETKDAKDSQACFDRIYAAYMEK